MPFSQGDAKECCSIGSKKKKKRVIKERRERDGKDQTVELICPPFTHLLSLTCVFSANLHLFLLHSVSRLFAWRHTTGQTDRQSLRWRERESLRTLPNLIIYVPLHKQTVFYVCLWWHRLCGTDGGGTVVAVVVMAVMAYWAHSKKWTPYDHDHFWQHGNHWHDHRLNCPVCLSSATFCLGVLACECQLFAGVSTNG